MTPVDFPKHFSIVINRANRILKKLGKYHEEGVLERLDDSSVDQCNNAKKDLHKTVSKPVGEITEQDLSEIQRLCDELESVFTQCSRIESLDTWKLTR